MPISSFMGLETALRGLIAEQEAVDTAGQNISNASTPGFSRQQTVQAATSALNIPGSGPNGTGAQLGTGVDVLQISRIRNDFLDVQYRAQNASLSSAQTLSTSLGEAQSAFNEPTPAGLQSQLDTFWSDWSNVANDPTSSAAKQTLVTDAQTLATSFNSLDSQLQAVSNDAQTQYNTLTAAGGQVDQYAQQIAQLNQSISEATSAGESPNELLDERDYALDELSSYGNVSVTKQANGMVDVSLGDAASPIVSGTTVNWPQTLTSATGGELGALLSVSSNSGPIAQYRSALDSVASGLANEVNALHTTPPFFSGTTAATLAVAVTASQVQTTSTGVTGANDVAVAIANLRGNAPDQTYAALVARVGSDDKAAQDNQTTAQAMVTTVTNSRESVSGVSLTEEMTQLMTAQQGYEASARALTAMDQLLETLVTRTGQAGL
jgi:flagellar hook-associated protein 1